MRIDVCEVRWAVDLTPDILRATYALLAETPPFTDWNLPDAEDVTFVVTRTRARCGRCWTLGGLDKKFKIEISTTLHAHLPSMLVTMAHEMVHVHQHQADGFKEKVSHGREFRALAAQVCAAHGFDPGAF